ncbi:procalin-like [Rhodnius prolixus]|uniref:procalin-like n=1 Tax=Rhodnius prolixus TaxID=13249 RepID=UPI003D189025
MKTIILLTFFGILGCIFCHVPTGPQGCRDVYDQAASDFKLDQFYKGSWYVTYAKYRNHTTLCTKFDMTSKPLQIKFDQDTLKVTCEGKVEQGARHTDYKCKISGESSTQYPGYESIVSVVDSDYKDYATVYTCMKTANHEDNFYVLSRTPGGVTPEAAKKSLQKLGEDFGKFVLVPCIQVQVINLKV